MNIKVILCNCNGLKLMPEGLDMNTLPYELEIDNDIAYAVVHPRLCGRGGVTMLHDLLKVAEPEDYFVVAGCGPENQEHFLGHVVEEMHFPHERFLSVDICGMDNARARTAILEAIGALLAQRNQGAMAVDAFGG